MVSDFGELLHRFRSAECAIMDDMSCKNSEKIVVRRLFGRPCVVIGMIGRFRADYASRYLKESCEIATRQ